MTHGHDNEGGLHLDWLFFQYKRQGDLLKRLDRCVTEHAAAWARHSPYQRGGNFITAKWCTGGGARDDCLIAEGSAWRRDQRVIELSTLFYPSAPRDAFGLGISALYTPPGTAWGASVSFWEGGKGIIGDGLHLTVRRYQEGQRDPDLTLTLGPRMSYQVHQTLIEWSTGLSPLEELPHYLASPEALRDRGRALVQGLRLRVLTAINDKQVEGCDYGEYHNDGVPPEEIPRPLTDEEEAAALSDAEAHFTARLDALDHEHEAMYQALMDTFPFKLCWP